ncbi:hypothetical protein RJ55_00939 [Drechmeria coniospora]|nr:hypothetical protein RJ55_00939 [Drechmeria coniospora]
MDRNRLFRIKSILKEHATDSIAAPHQGSNICNHRKQPSIPSEAMYKQFYRIYTCGCRKPEEFVQCSDRIGTNVKCTPVTWQPKDPSVHMCTKHMVKVGKDEIQRR